MDKIKRVSLLFRIFFQIMLVSLPMLLIYAWATSPESTVLFNGFINLSFIPRNYIATGSHTSQILHVLSPAEKIARVFS